MLRKLLATGMGLFCLIAFGTAQEAATGVADTAAAAPSPTVFTASADLYYRYDFAETVGNNRTSFTNSHNSFELGMISAKVDHTMGKVGMTADLGFGRRAEEFSYNDDRTRLAIKQLNVNYSFRNGLKISAGSWATHVGYELVDAYLNRNYSMSYLFSYGPFTHTGVKAEKTFGKSGLMLGVANPTDLRSAFNGSKYLIGQFSTTAADDKLKVWLNYQGGKPVDSVKVNQFDLVVSTAIADKFSLGFNSSVANYHFWEKENDFGDGQMWWGAALYLNTDPLDWLGFTLRAEYFSDDKGLNVFAGTPDGGSLIATTLSAQVKAGNLTLTPEVRFENASEEIFFKSDDSPSKTAVNVLVAAVYHF
jgi:hypothetical protein